MEMSDADYYAGGIVSMPSQRFLNSLHAYVDHHIRPGGFLQSILENDLRSAVTRADVDASHEIVWIVKYCLAQLPANSWGSKEKVEAWLKSTE